MGFLKRFSRKKSQKSGKTTEPITDDRMLHGVPPTPPRIVKVAPESPGGLSAMTESTRKYFGRSTGGATGSFLLPGMTDDDGGTHIFEDSSRNTPGGSHRSPQAQAKSKTDISQSSSFLGRSKYFRQLCKWAFHEIDTDNSGEVDEKELYSGLLLIHLKLATYAGPAACRPVSHEYVSKIFKKMDEDNSGSLDETEFLEVMKLLCSSILLRVTIQWTMTLMIVPLLAQYLLDGIQFLIVFVAASIAGVDIIEDLWKALVTFTEDEIAYVSSFIPSMIKATGSKLYELLCMIPESVWEVLPLTLLTCILGCLAVPCMLFKLDDHIQNLAEKKKVAAELKANEKKSR
mmetsp:Transcript_23982/g.43370  ORF Transcript_23982/g.43370 Transcript_23982/m.43370 type:complete len:345 (-) Transcript_23982:179-1213(-)